MNILVADDDSDDREFLWEALSQLDKQFNCTFAKDGIEALELLQNSEQLPAFIFLDINMPRMRGDECLIAIKKYPRLKDIPVVIVSSITDQRYIDRFLTLGAHRYINKPDTFDQWIESLEDVLKS
jgi:CheY-like chemotaxis protein